MTDYTVRVGTGRTARLPHWGAVCDYLAGYAKVQGLDSPRGVAVVDPHGQATRYVLTGGGGRPVKLRPVKQEDTRT